MTDRGCGLLLDARRARKQGPAAIARRQRARLREIVAFARTFSPYYGELYRGLAEGFDDPALLPVTNKKLLMERFDEWVTDREVTVAKARAFVDNPDLIGERFLGKYIVAITSGTTGTPGIFLLDDGTLAVTNALALRMMGAWLGIKDVIRILARGGRMAMVMAMGGHYAEAVAAARLRKGSRLRAKAILPLSAHLPLSELVS